MRRVFGIQLVLMLLSILLLISCGKPDARDADLLPAEEQNPPVIEAPPVESPPAEVLPPVESTPEPAPNSTPPEVTPEEPKPETSPTGYDAEGLPITEARAKASLYYEKPLTGYGFLAVTSVPSDATVYLDGSHIGVTPIVKYRTKIKGYTIHVEYAGYDTFVKSIYIKDNQTTNVSAALVSRTSGGGTGVIHTGSIAITADVVGTTIFIDSRFANTAPQTITEVSPGSHEIRLRKTGYREEVRTVTVVAGKTVKLDIHMRAT